MTEKNNFDSNEERLARFQRIRCSCNRIIDNPKLIQEYVHRARKVAEEVQIEGDAKVAVWRQKKGLTQKERVNGLYRIEQESKIKLMDNLAGVFRDLGIQRYCCRAEIADAARQGLYDEEIVDPETRKTSTIPLKFDDTDYYIIP